VGSTAGEGQARALVRARVASREACSPDSHAATNPFSTPNSMASGAPAAKRVSRPRCGSRGTMVASTNLCLPFLRI
jgi:hypothetical protein